MSTPQPCSCAEAQAHLERFLDRECEETVAQRLQHHVETCEHCRALADAEVHVRDILRSRCAEQAPESLRLRVLEQLTVMRSTASVTSVTQTTVSAGVAGDTRVTRVLHSSTQVLRQRD